MSIFSSPGIFFFGIPNLFGKKRLCSVVLQPRSHAKEEDGRTLIYKVPIRFGGRGFFGGNAERICNFEISAPSKIPIYILPPMNL